MSSAVQAYAYGLSENNDVRAVHVEQRSDGMSFDILFHDEFYGHFDLPYVGQPLLYDSIGVIALGILLQIDAALLQESLKTFPRIP